MSDMFIRRLESLSPLTEGDKALINELIAKGRAFSPNDNIVIREGDVPRHVHLVTRGLAYRYKTLEDGKRQIVAFMLPGDICDLHVFILRAMDHNIGCVDGTSIVEVARNDVQRLLDEPRIARALLMSVLVDEAILREWVTNLGQRSAERRIGHLFCELHARMKAVGLTHDGRCDLPLTQNELADTVGLSTVHINRSLQALRKDQLIEFGSGRLNIPDVTRLYKMSGFRSNYLHLDTLADAA